MKLPEPMLASTGRTPLSALAEDDGWSFEEKIDGIRVLVGWDGHKLRLVSRTGKDLLHAFSEIGRSVESTRPAQMGPFVLDGELQLAGQRTGDLTLRHLIARANTTRTLVPRGLAKTHFTAHIYAFDCLMSDNTVLMALPLRRRREVLSDVLEALGVAFSPVPSGQAPLLLAETKAAGREGVVAKRLDSRYLPGKRSTAWLKYKHSFQLRCIAYGYAPSTSSNRPFGALLLAMVDPTSGLAAPIGEVGSGFSEFELAWMKREIDSGQFPVVTVSCMGRTAKGLREPVFVNVIKNADQLSCTNDQLDQLPIN